MMSLAHVARRGGRAMSKSSLTLSTAATIPTPAAVAAPATPPPPAAPKPADPILAKVNFLRTPFC